MTVEQVLQLAGAGFSATQIAQLAQVQSGQVQTQPAQASQPMAGQVQAQPAQASQPMAGQVQASQPMAGQVQSTQPMVGQAQASQSMAVQTNVPNQFSLGVGGTTGNLDFISQLLGTAQAQNRNNVMPVGQNAPTLDDVTNTIINGAVAGATGEKKEV